MQILLSRLITKKIMPLLFVYSLVACTSNAELAERELLKSNISYPFYDNKPIGIEQPEEKFIIHSAVGNAEYSVEIPDSAEDYDIEIPLAALNAGTVGGPDRPRGLARPNLTDRERVKNLPSIEKQDPSGTALMDKSFGVGQTTSPYNSPSYTLGLAKITKLFKSRQLEYALIEINNMLAFYPNSPGFIR